MKEPAGHRVVRYSRKPLTAEQSQQLKALADLPDDRIDFSDIPEATDAFFDKAVRGDYFRIHPIKKQTTLRLDADILDWFKQQSAPDGNSRGYQTRINKALRDYVAAQRKAAGKAG